MSRLTAIEAIVTHPACYSPRSQAELEMLMDALSARLVAINGIKDTDEGRSEIEAIEAWLAELDAAHAANRALEGVRV